MTNQTYSQNWGLYNLSQTKEKLMFIRLLNNAVDYLNIPYDYKSNGRPHIPYDDKVNYIGPNTFLEMAIALDYGKKIFVLNPILDSDRNYEELISMSPIVINGSLEEIKQVS